MCARDEKISEIKKIFSLFLTSFIIELGFHFFNWVLIPIKTQLEEQKLSSQQPELTSKRPLNDRLGEERKL